MYLYDTAKHKQTLYNRNDCKIIEKYMDVDEARKYKDIDDIIVFSDIRTISDGAKEPSTINILNDNKIQNDILKVINPKFSLLKQRLPFPDDYNGEEIIYPYGIEYLQTDSGWSNERRLFVERPIKFITKTIDLDDPDNLLVESEQKMMYYNFNMNNNYKLRSFLGMFHINNFRKLLNKPLLRDIKEYNIYRNKLINIFY